MERPTTWHPNAPGKAPNHIHTTLRWGSPRSILKLEMLLGTLDATPKFPNIPVSLQARETGLILRCARRAGNPFRTTQWNRLSCRDQEGRRGSDVQYSCLENPTDRGAWQATVCEVAKNQTQLSN